MLLSSVPVRRSDPMIRRILAATFPDYRGRKVRISLVDDRPISLDYHRSGGSRDVARMVRIADGAIGAPALSSPWNDSGAVVVPPGHLLVVHSHFLGSDAGIAIYGRPDSLPALNGGAS
jgi:hypothetical protein